MATQEPAVLNYQKSDMILAVHSDAGYLNENEARSRAGGAPFPIQKCPFSLKQRGSPQRCRNHQSHHVVRRRSGDGGTRRMTHIGRVRPQAAPHSHPNGQFNSRGHRQQSRPAKTHKSHGHVVPLATRPC
jgi:hypothetical protein